MDRPQEKSTELLVLEDNKIWSRDVYGTTNGCPLASLEPMYNTYMFNDLEVVEHRVIIIHVYIVCKHWHCKSNPS